MKTALREATALVKDKAPAIVDERILGQILDDVADYTGQLMGKMTNLKAGEDKTIEMAHDIIRDGLLREIAHQVNETMMAEADKRITKLFEKK